MSKPIEESPLSRGDFLKGAAGVAGSLAIGSLAGPDLAKAIPRRRLSPVKVVVMSQELTTGAGNAGTPSTSDFEDTHPNIKIELLNVDPAKFQAMMAAGQPPDIWRTQAPLVPQWAKRGQLLNLDKYFRSSDLIHPKQLTRYAGLDPSVLQSGEEHYQGRISKNGNSLLRTVLVEAAHTVALHDTGSLRQFYLRKAKQIGHMKAIVALARKLLIVAWRMLLTGETYRAAKPHLVTRKHRHLQKLSTARSGANGDRVLAALVRQYWNPRVREARSRTKAPA